jgi:ABC-type lipoprotein export system ATPase subunit
MNRPFTYVPARSGESEPAPTDAPAPARPLLIRTLGLEKYFQQGGSRYYVLRNIALEIREGEFVSIMGPSGAGKSTLLNVLGMHDSEWSGAYRFLDRPVHECSSAQRATLRNTNVGFVFQSYHLLDDLTVAENLDMPLSYRGLGKSDRAGRVADVLDRFGIVAKKDLYPRQLSGGQQQLVAIARALIIEPRVILADEPTGNLHSDQGQDIMQRFRALNAAGTTIVQVTHSEINASFGDRVIRMRDGWIESDAPARPASLDR